MTPTITKLHAGKYRVLHYGYVFIIDNQNLNVWTISNHFGVELFRDSTKKSLINTLASYGFDGTMNLHQQEYCKYA